MGEIIAVVNQKGGVGKTTTCINLAACLSENRKVLLIDIDPQGNTTSGLGINKRTITHCIYDVILNAKDINEVITDTKLNNLKLIPATLNLAGAEVELVFLENHHTRLKSTIITLKDSYDYIIIDTPPSLGLLTINAIVCADSLLIPIQCEYYAMEAIERLLTTIELIKEGFNKDLKIKGIILTMYQRTNISQQVEQEIRNYFKEKVFNTVIPRTVKLAEAPSYGEPITIYDKNSKATLAYKNLSEEILKLEEVDKLSQFFYFIGL